jgi:carbonic anhydrase
MLASYLLLIVSGYLANGAAYNYSHGGSDWPGTCGTGFVQSPLNIEYSRSKIYGYDMGSIQWHSIQGSVTGNWSDTGLTLAPTAAEGLGNISFFSTKDMYIGSVSEISFYSPSQHTLQGEHADLEVTLKVIGNHTEYTGYFVSLFFYVGSGTNNFIEQVLNYTSKVPGQKISFGSAFNNKLGYINDFYSYDGSLPYPPCNQTIKWFIIPAVQHIGKKQYFAFYNHWQGNKTFAGRRGNNRNLQDYNGRYLNLYRGL